MKLRNSEFNTQDVLNSWDVKKEQQKADFMEHLYEVYLPVNHCYTALWQRFLYEEAGPYCRDMYFERLEAVRLYQEQLEKESKSNV